jgi:hypothetical protein
LANVGLSKKWSLERELCKSDARGGWGGFILGVLSVDTIEDIAVLGALLVFSSLSLAVVVLLY